jgi:hypothetical protein
MPRRRRVSSPPSGASTPAAADGIAAVAGPLFKCVSQVTTALRSELEISERKNAELRELISKLQDYFPEEFSHQKEIVGVQVRYVLRGRRGGRRCGRVDEMKVARMQVRRVYTHQRDRIPSTVNVDHRISLGVVMIADRTR